MIEVKNVTKKYSKNTVLNNVSFTIQKGKFTFIAGRNGSGKTTLLKCLLDLERYEGEITYENQSLDSVREDISVIYDNPPLYKHLTGYQNIELLLNKKLSNKEIEETNVTRLQPDVLRKKVKTYSFGQIKKLSLLIAFLSNPRYLFLDEVSNGLDYESLLDVKRILQENETEMTIVAIGHQFEFYSSIIDDLIVVNNGSVITFKDFQQRGGDLVEEYKLYIQ
ncbi:ATP-binding cassette domain-containing protein [Brevibacillus borstelensis]|uniref:ATP-binding cassette domain-containing protein n=1 Tax=Brevibacillus borstelensis TaxID=45462 RepID=UPI0030BBEDF2